MKTRNEITFAKTSGIFLAALLLLAGEQLSLHAQLVADGGTTNLTIAMATSWWSATARKWPLPTCTLASSTVLPTIA